MKRDFPDHEASPWIPNLTMIQAIGATHDLGHPPFGHGGEVAFHYAMRGDGGFEGNGQTLRILSRLEKFSASNGANLSRRSLLGVLKYPAPMSAVRSTDEKLTPALLGDASVVRPTGRPAVRPSAISTAIRMWWTGCSTPCPGLSGTCSRPESRWRATMARPSTSCSIVASWTSPTISPSVCTTLRTH